MVHTAQTETTCVEATLRQTVYVTCQIMYVRANKVCEDGGGAPSAPLLSPPAALYGNVVNRIQLLRQLCVVV